ncbi:MAG: S8 family serine peptidase [Gemmatimonadota bacterium]|nr:S8 family serine peptidase [Gemmatimonadota bacterium]
MKASSATDSFVPGRLLVKFRPGFEPGRIARSFGASIDEKVVLDILALHVPVGDELDLSRALGRHPGVEFAEPDFIRTFGLPCELGTCSKPLDPYFGYKWDLHNDGEINSSTGQPLASTAATDADMDWLEAHEELGEFSGSAVLGIMDTGILATHEDLTGRVLAQHDFHDDDSDAADDNGHGTHVAGIAAAHADNEKGVAGVAYGPNIQLAVAKVCGPSGWFFFFTYGCSTSNVAQGIKWAVDNGASVLNISLGGSSGSSTEQEALQYARDNGVLPFCSAGNDSGSVSYPAAFPECVAVSATDWGDDLASYSNFGPEVELSAPGGDSENDDGYSYILSTYYDGNSSYAFMAGTSMASPQAAGLAVLLHALGVTDDVTKLDRMKRTADDLGAAGTDDRFGAGRINVLAAVRDDGGGGTDSNDPPAASFTASCTDLSCDFTDTSTDDTGIVSWSWDFGDGSGSTAQHPSHAYAAGGTYTVTLTVTDGDGATDQATQDVTVAAPEPIELTATVVINLSIYKEVDLEWSPSGTSAQVDVYRDGSQIATTTNDGAYRDSFFGSQAQSTYQVCEAGTQVCSNEAVADF